MSRYKKYTKEEDKQLLSLCEDFDDISMISIAKIALKYGICQDRSAEALANHIGKIKTNQKPAVNPVENEILERYSALDAKYEDLMKIVFGTARLFETDYKSGLRFDFWAIREWLLANEGDRFYCRVRELEQRKDA